jgi:feruloyl esterase
MVPGMSHCGGGAGPNAFGNTAFGGPPVPADPQHDVFLALVHWVEFGQAPDKIIATKYVNDNPASGVSFTRPLCVFPNVANYKGTGNSADASNWECVPGIENSVTKAADAVLRDRGDLDGDGDGDH